MIGMQRLTPANVWGIGKFLVENFEPHPFAAWSPFRRYVWLLAVPLPLTGQLRGEVLHRCMIEACFTRLPAVQRYLRGDGAAEDVSGDITARGDGTLRPSAVCGVRGRSALTQRSRREARSFAMVTVCRSPRLDCSTPSRHPSG